MTQSRDFQFPINSINKITKECKKHSLEHRVNLGVNELFGVADV